MEQLSISMVVPLLVEDAHLEIWPNWDAMMAQTKVTRSNGITSPGSASYIEECAFC